MMKALPAEFRYRYWLHAVIIALGFWAPWTYFHRNNEIDVVPANSHVWGILATWLGGHIGADNTLTAFNVILAAAILLALLAAWLRTWGSAYIGSGVVQSPQLHTAERSGVSALLTHDGPYRHLRNPLYLGTFLHVLAISILMPRSGAIFAVILITLLQFRLIGAEEHFLEANLGDAYDEYYDKVPSLIPTLRPAIPGTGLKPHWGQAFLGEIYFWGAVAAFAFGGWRYNQGIITMIIIVSFGVSLITKAFIPKPSVAA